MNKMKNMKNVMNKMSMTKTKFPLARGRGLAAAMLLVSVGVGGCESPKSPAPITGVNGTSLPEMPTPMPGQALVSGFVTDGDGNPVAGATVKVAETDATAKSDDTGAYHMMIPSDSTVTLLTSATGFASTYRDSIMAADQASISRFDVLLLATDKLNAMNALGTTDPTTTRGLVAVRLHSLSDTCVLPGAHLAVWPPKVATVIYSSKALVTGGLDNPDKSVDSVQSGVQIDAWLTAVVTPGNMVQVSIDYPGCHLLAPSPSVSGVQYPGVRRVDAQTLTMADLFFN